MSKTAILVSIAGAATLACITVYGISKYSRKKSITSLFEQEIALIGRIDVNHDGTISFDQFVKIARIIEVYSAECKKIDKKSNQLLRQKRLKERDFFNYTYAVIEGYETKKETVEYIQSLVFKSLTINKDIYETSFRKHRHNLMTNNASNTKIPLLTKKQIEELKIEKEKLEKSLEVERYVPEELEKDCWEVMGENWHEEIKGCIIEDILYGKYGVNKKEIN